MCLYVEALLLSFNTKNLLRSLKNQVKSKVCLTFTRTTSNKCRHTRCCEALRANHPQNSVLVDQIVIQYKQPSTLSDWAEATKRLFVKLQLISAEPEQQRTFFTAGGSQWKDTFRLWNHRNGLNYVWHHRAYIDQHPKWAAEKSESYSEKRKPTKKM